MMQEIRDLLGRPIKITSGYRSPDLNRAVGGNPRSQHMQGEAIDFVCPDFGSPDYIARFLKSKDIPIDQCLVELSWVHISFKMRKEANRRMFGFYIRDELGRYIFTEI